VILGQGQTVSVNQLMVFHDVSPITVNCVAFTSVSASTNDEWLVPDEFISGPGKLIFMHYSFVLVNCNCNLNSK